MASACASHRISGRCNDQNGAVEPFESRDARFTSTVRRRGGRSIEASRRVQDLRPLWFSRGIPHWVRWLRLQHPRIEAQRLKTDRHLSAIQEASGVRLQDSAYRGAKHKSQRPRKRGKPGCGYMQSPKHPRKRGPSQHNWLCRFWRRSIPASGERSLHKAGLALPKKHPRTLGDPIGHDSPLCAMQSSSDNDRFAFGIDSSPSRHRRHNANAFKTTFSSLGIDR